MPVLYQKSTRPVKKLPPTKGNTKTSAEISGLRIRLGEPEFARDLSEIEASLLLDDLESMSEEQTDNDDDILMVSQTGLDDNWDKDFTRTESNLDKNKSRKRADGATGPSVLNHRPSLGEYRRSTCTLPKGRVSETLANRLSTYGSGQSRACVRQLLILLMNECQPKEIIQRNQRRQQIVFEFTGVGLTEACSSQLLRHTQNGLLLMRRNLSLPLNDREAMRFMQKRLEGRYKAEERNLLHRRSAPQRRMWSVLDNTSDMGTFDTNRSLTKQASEGTFTSDISEQYFTEATDLGNKVNYFLPKLAHYDGPPERITNIYRTARNLLNKYPRSQSSNKSAEESY
ncbi:unnamed protein product [Dicrocoelium dendriticum]|nr:unnamed protein product [Dicrocoelium dendriticum]